jgi:hypothetical protein
VNIENNRIYKEIYDRDRWSVHERDLGTREQKGLLDVPAMRQVPGVRRALSLLYVM